ncbi:MAG: 2-dehydro-3-deoxyphosphogluconate aldolase [Actinobacteria bacterium 13_1_20CM_3_71_11]|nr:MAG: 2-dehydro-3-deoxyphosphogluconate aldolase [Actinobacteria bacterium 13_1_20CM_3_71_11]
MMADPLAGGVVAILRGRSASHLDAVLDVLVEAGIRSLEVTLTTPEALPVVRRSVARFGPSVAIGAGTVRTIADVSGAVDAGAAYLVSPHTDPVLAARARELGVAYLPGAFTPTEIVAAMAAGATAVKLFPARLGGPRYLRDIREPLPDVPIVPTGGVSAENAAEWFAAGAVAVGAGGSLIGDALDGGSLDALRDRALALVAAAGGRHD